MSALAELVVDELDHRAVERRVRGDILALIDAETVEVAYQPIFDLSDNRCLGVEALARFPEPFEETERTFAIAEQLGLGFRLEELVVRKAWDVQSRLGRGQFLALNLTPESLLELAKRANQRLDIELSSVVVEITEHRAIEAYSDLRKQLKRLRARGLRIAVDDVGAGYASLRHVLELRPDIVKVDRWLIDGLAGDCARKVAVSSFVSLARNLGSLVVAEGVERPADREAARELGLHAAQGYLLARPSSNPDDLSSWTRGTTTPTRAIASNSARRRPPRRQQTRRPKALAGS